MSEHGNVPCLCPGTPGPAPGPPPPPSTPAPKIKKKAIYTMKFKREVVEYAKSVDNNREAARFFKVDESLVRRWGKALEKIAEKDIIKDQKRVAGGGRKPDNAEMETKVMDWITKTREQNLRVTRKRICAQAKKISLDLDPSSDFKASDGWCTRFMKRKHLSVRRRTNISQRTPKDVIDKVTRFILYVKRMFVLKKYKPENVFAMDETAVWYDSVGNTTVEPTGSKTVQLKSTGHEKANITVALTASMDGTKKKPFIVIKGKGKTAEAKKAKERKDCIVEFSDNGWLNEKVTLSYQSKMHPTTSFHSRLNIWDAYRCHTAPSVKAAHKKSRIDMAVIPGGCTSVIQASDVSWNKPFKARLTEAFDNFMESGDKTYTKAGNVRSMSMMQICDTVVKCWDEISSDIIRKSFEACGQVPNVDASNINCFKEGKICHDGLERLEKLLGLDINKVDLANLCELPEGRIQQVDNIMDEDIGDGIAELIDNELILDEDDDEDDGLLVDIMGPTEDLGRIEEEDDSGDEIEGGSFFQQSSLLSIKRGSVQNNNRKRPFDSVESSPSLKSGPSRKRWQGENI